jgi:hypothetical protein
MNEHPEQIITGDGCDHDKNIFRLSPGIEKQTSEQEPYISDLPRKYVITYYHYWKKITKEYN